MIGRTTIEEEEIVEGIQVAVAIVMPSPGSAGGSHPGRGMRETQLPHGLTIGVATTHSRLS